jgi:hypothetical protein
VVLVSGGVRERRQGAVPEKGEGTVPGLGEDLTVGSHLSGVKNKMKKEKWKREAGRHGWADWAASVQFLFSFFSSFSYSFLFSLIPL